MIDPRADSEHMTESDLQQTLIENLLTCQPLARIGRHFQGIIHNLNGHLQNAQLQLELLQMPFQCGTNPLEPEQVELRLRHLTDELDYLSQMLSFWGQQVDYESLLQEGWVEVNQIMHEALTFMHADLFFKHQVSTEIKLQKDLPMVFGNEFAFANVFGALLENAVEAMRHSDQRRLAVTTFSEGPKVLAAIEYTGCRLQEENGENDLFIPPLNGKRSSWERDCVSAIQLHSRLGLYLANHMIRPYGGEISWENRPNNSVFTLHLPAKSHRA